MVLNKARFSLVDIFIAVILLCALPLSIYIGSELDFTTTLHTILGFYFCYFWLAFLVHSPLGKKVLDYNSRGILFFALIFIFLYIAHTTIFSRASDIQGHFGYIEMLYSGHMPLPTEGWQTYQPPLYYVLATPFYAVGEMLGLARPFDIVRYLSVAIHLTFLLYTAAFLKMVIKRNSLIYLGLVLAIIWPVGVIYSAKINNDVLINLISLITLYYLTKWFSGNDSKDLWTAVIIALIGIAVKSTALVLCGVIFICTIIKLLNKETSLSIILPPKKLFVAITLIGILTFSLNYGRTAYYKWETGESQNFLVGNMTDADYDYWTASYIKDDSIYNYVIFDPIKFVKEPYVYLYDTDEGGRRLFWNTAVKTLLIGAGAWRYPVIGGVISSLYLLLLVYITFSLIPMLYKSKVDRNLFTSAIILSAAGLLAQAYMRFVLPVSGFGETRYTFYIVPVIILALIRSIEWHKEHSRRILYKLGLFMTVILIVILTAFLCSHYYVY